MANLDPSRRLHFLDGLRGLACLYVLLFHSSTVSLAGQSEHSQWMTWLKVWISRGHFSVVFFIVLSGYSLMLPIAKAGTGELVGGFASYVRRRARRILPPYYAAIILSIALILAYNQFSRRYHFGQPLEAALSTGSIVSHLLLFHNATFDWAYRINGPLWSVATEWHIYFVFALLMLPFWKRTGSVATTVAAWIIGSLPFFLLPPDENLFWACPWFLGSFALGMWGAVIAFAATHRESWLLNRAPWGVFTLVCFAALAALVAADRADSWAMPVVDLIVSLFAFCIINACAQRTLKGEQASPLLRIFGSKALVYLGGFSYSLYLVQHPILRFTEKVVGKMTKSSDVNVLIHLLIVVPAIMGLAWVFAELFERPFTSGAILLPAIRRRFGVEREVSPSPQR